MARILLIEDEVYIQKVWMRALKEHTLTVVSSGLAAIKALESADRMFDIILSDYNIEGGLTGIDVYVVATRISPAYSSKYIFCSANDLARQFAELEGVLFLEKPFPVKQLLIELQAKLSHQKYLDETDTAPFSPISIDSLSEADPEALASAAQ